MVRLILNYILKINNTQFQSLIGLKTIVLLLIACVFSCQNSSKIEKEISQIHIDLNIERFDQMFASSTAYDLPELQYNYPFLFSKRYSDSVWINRMSDPIQKLQNKAVDSVFEDFGSTR